MLCQHGEALGVGAGGIVHALRLRLVGVVVAGNAAAGHGHETRVAVGIVGVVDLVADAPEDHARVIAVAQDHVCEIALVPRGKGSVVALIFGRIYIVSLPPLVFGTFPLVKRLVYHEEAEDIAQRVQLGRVRIVAHADRVASHLLEFCEPAPPHLAGDSGTETARVVVQADALEQIGLPVEEKASVRMKAEASDADLHLMYLVGFPVGDIRFHRVQVRGFRRPEFGCLYGSGICDPHGGVRQDGCLRYGFAHQLSGIVKDDIGDSDHAALACGVDQIVDDFVVGAVVGGSRRVEENAVVCGIDVFGYSQCDLSRDAGAGKPARVGDLPPVDIHADDIVGIKTETVCHVISEGDVAVWTLAEVGGVAPYAAVFVDTVKVDADLLSLPRRVGGDADAIPANAACKISGAAGVLF